MRERKWDRRRIVVYVCGAAEASAAADGGEAEGEGEGDAGVQGAPAWGWGARVYRNAHGGREGYVADGADATHV